MFDSKKNKTDRVADAVDLIIDFATLGEYGLEPITSQGRSCENRHHPGRRTYSTGTWDAAVARFAVQS